MYFHILTVVSRMMRAMKVTVTTLLMMKMTRMSTLTVGRMMVAQVPYTDTAHDINLNWFCYENGTKT